MADLYNDIYTTADEFHREMDRVMALTREDKISVAAGLTKVWSEFEKIFEDETGFKQATAFERTRHRLALLKRTESLVENGQGLEARGVKLLALYLRGLGHIRSDHENRMARRLQHLLEADLRRRMLRARSDIELREATFH